MSMVRPPCCLRALRPLAFVAAFCQLALGAEAHVLPSWVEQSPSSDARAASPTFEAASTVALVGDPVSVVWIRAVPMLIELNGAEMQTIEFNLSNGGGAVEVEVGVAGDTPQLHVVAPGRHRLTLPIPAVAEPELVDVVLSVAGQAPIAQTIEVRPVRRWDVYLLPQSHVDIGFTHTQDEVEQQNWQFYETSIAKSRATASYQEGSVFKWNVEVLWAVESYLAQATPEKVAEFSEAVENGWIGLDALYANMLTGLESREELVHVLDAARALREKYGFSIDSAMITDVPGATWGTVSVLADSGVRYWSIGANRVRSGNFHRTWDDRPFYWVDPSGEREVLTWSSGAGYTFFVLQFLRSGERIVDHLYELEQSGYPYDITYLRYAIFDNFGPDTDVAEVVRDWNATHLSPRLLLATTREPFEALEARYGDSLPRVSGDFTGYWEDGAASSARETGTNRRAVERLVQAEKLWALLDPAGYPADEFGRAWRNALLFDEHTWGSFWSVIDPENPAVPAIWNVKKGYAENADAMSRALLEGAAAPVADRDGTVESVRVFNTSSWPRTELVEIPAAWKRRGDGVRDARRRPVPSQVLSTGALAFVATDVPALGSATYELRRGRPWAPRANAIAVGATLANETLRVEVDPVSGAIARFSAAGVPVDLALSGAGNGLADYQYVDGRDPAAPTGVGPVAISVEESGPLVASLRIDSAAPGATSLRRTVRLVSGLEHVEIEAVLAKTAIFEPEAVHIAFPFHVPDGVARLDVPWSVIEPDLDQIDGANKNVFTVQSWLDFSNDDYGITFSSIDAPLVELGSLNVDPEVVGYVEEVGPTTVLYSLAMHNYWEVNYRAAQEGPTPLRYAMRPHGSFDAVEAARFGESRRQPLVVVPVDAVAGTDALLEVAPPDVLVSALKPLPGGEGFVLRLFGASGEDREVDLRWKKGPFTLFESDLSEVPGAELPKEPLRVPGYGMLTIVAKPDPEPVVPLPRDDWFDACVEPGGAIRYVFDVGTPLARANVILIGTREETHGALRASVSLIAPDGQLRHLESAGSRGVTIGSRTIGLLTPGEYALRVEDAGGDGGCFAARARVRGVGRRTTRVWH